jgi:precorrin-4 methylase
MKDKERVNTMTKVCKAERITRTALIIIGTILLILTIIKEIKKEQYKYF